MSNETAAGAGSGLYPFTRSSFIAGVVRFKAFPQGLKPVILMRLIGTAEAVPFQSPVMKQLLETIVPAASD
jgi:hypothetical protein